MDIFLILQVHTSLRASMWTVPRVSQPPAKWEKESVSGASQIQISINSVLPWIICLKSKNSNCRFLCKSWILLLKHPNKLALLHIPCSFPAVPLSHTLNCPSSASRFSSSEGLMQPTMEAVTASFTATTVRSSYCSCTSPWLQSDCWLSLAEWCWVQVRADISRSAEGNQCACRVPT